MIRSFLNRIKSINYALTKIDVPYNPDNFPDSYAIGKDLDIYVSELDYDNIKMITKTYFNQYSRFKIKIIEKNSNFRLRLEINNKLHYQIDITVDDNLVKDRVIKDNYYILSLENETKVRLNEIKEHPNKIHHKIWLDKNIRNYN